MRSGVFHRVGLLRMLLASTPGVLIASQAAAQPVNPATESSDWVSIVVALALGIGVLGANFMSPRRTHLD